MADKGHNIDEDFAAAMRELGGRRPAEIDPACVSASNADIVLTEDNVILEVKTFVEETSEKLEFRYGMNKLYHAWINAGRIPKQNGPNIRINPSELPEDCAREFMAFVTKRVKAVVSKGNRQIREIKKNLSMPEAKGILVLCNSGNSFLRPDVILHGLHHALGQKHSSIDWLIYFTHGLPVQIPGVPRLTNLFTQPVRHGHQPMPDVLFARIRDAWMRKVASFGPSVIAYDVNDSNLLFGAEHVKRGAEVDSRGRSA